MLALTYLPGVEQKAQYFGLISEGDYLDMYPLFKFSNTSNPTGFVKASEFRARHFAAAQLELEHLPTVRIDSKPKRIFYHQFVIKPVLYALGLLELEEHIASVWDMDELPMLQQDQFDYWDIELVIYDHDGTPRPKNIVRVFQRRINGWFNLTQCTSKHDGDDVVTRKPSDIARSNLALFRQLYIKDHTPEEVKAQDAVIAKKDTSVAAKKALAELYVDTHYCRGETWCHPAVFLDTMMTMSADFRAKTFNSLISAHGEVINRRILSKPVFSNVEYVSLSKMVECCISTLGDLIEARIVK